MSNPVQVFLDKNNIVWQQSDLKPNAIVLTYTQLGKLLIKLGLGKASKVQVLKILEGGKGE
jgi:hypothetical protein